MITAVDKVVAEMASYETCSTGNQNTIALHARLGLDGRAIARHVRCIALHEDTQKIRTLRGNAVFFEKDK